MKKQTLSFHIVPTISISTLLILFFTSCKQESFSPALTQEFTLQSVSNGATYEIKVALPVHYEPGIKKYGTVYILDGDENFDFVTINCREISNDHSVDNVIVVSIGYGNDRSLDYTPTQIDFVTGGAPLFVKFIQDELIPKIEQSYSVDTKRSSRIILGHSYGGLFCAYAFASDNILFGNYILLSPSIWYDNEIVMTFEKNNRLANREREQLVFLGLGEMENMGRMQAPFEAFYQTLLKNYPNIRIAKNLEKNLGHVGSKNPNIILGLKYYFEHRLL